MRLRCADTNSFIAPTRSPRSVRLWILPARHTSRAAKFKLKERRREGAKVIKAHHDLATPFELGVAHPKVSRALKAHLRDMHRRLDPVALFAEKRAAQTELLARHVGIAAM